eukprot:CAMPEP_0182419110 /NCGR_PEP_ID=MMETSP1167-20130531/3509_1 /TAXON_ID=2988 /ORGANISM="Mallomonas Sp, Strain CCMP3275" /LENGTH=483 /DNA_ID=CAMNT_0024593745 /DNA_START=99 /DNA_END=1550 /DNA_ORIENTATION=+
MKLFCIFSAFFYIGSVASLVHNLVIRNDPRNLFKIETFGFIPGGKINITVEDFSLGAVKSGTNSSLLQTGFILRKFSSETAAEQDLEMIMEEMKCILNHPGEDDYVIDLSNQKTWRKLSKGYIIKPGAAGLYSLVFARCRPMGPHYVSFKLSASFRNPGPNYLSAGDAPLPTMYLVFFLLFLAALGVWVTVLVRPNPPGTDPVKVHSIHYMMAVLLLLKTLCLLFESIRFHYIASTGASNLAEAWSIVFYIFTFLKGVMLFTVILLIGSGWSLMKGYLNDREKKIIMIVLTLQVIDNVAMIVLEETAPGSQGWLTWRDLLHLVDVMCCCAILFPIVWSIRHLRQAAGTDGKAQANLSKLTLFRQFYVMVVVYVYFTRIVVFLLSATIPFYLMWLGPMFTELATLLFFTITGFKFRPASNNPYLAVKGEEEEEEEQEMLGREREREKERERERGEGEFGLKEDGVELSEAGGGSGSGRMHMNDV